MITFYHNPRCSKSRAALNILESAGVNFEIIRYLENPPTAETIKNICELLAITPKELVRTSESIYKELFLIPDDQWCYMMNNHPILMQRPIVVHGDRAVIGRPPEKIKDIL